MSRKDGFLEIDAFGGQFHDRFTSSFCRVSPLVAPRTVCSDGLSNKHRNINGERGRGRFSNGSLEFETTKKGPANTGEHRRSQASTGEHRRARTSTRWLDASLRKGFYGSILRRSFSSSLPPFRPFSSFRLSSCPLAAFRSRFQLFSFPSPFTLFPFQLGVRRRSAVFRSAAAGPAFSCVHAARLLVRRPRESAPHEAERQKGAAAAASISPSLTISSRPCRKIRDTRKSISTAVGPSSPARKTYYRSLRNVRPSSLASSSAARRELASLSARRRTTGSRYRTELTIPDDGRIKFQFYIRRVHTRDERR